MPALHHLSPYLIPVLPLTSPHPPPYPTILNRPRHTLQCIGTGPVKCIGTVPVKCIGTGPVKSYAVHGHEQLG